ncbi:MAG: glucose-6-phosphate dehydrogenase, partial [bacterium]
KGKIMGATAQRCFDECTFVILGATGDLTKRKLIPAIYKLIAEQKLCKFAIVGASFDTVTVQDILAQAKFFVPAANPEIWQKLEKAFYFYSMDFYNARAYVGFCSLLNNVEKENNLVGNRVFYFATLPKHFITITQNLVQSCIVKKSTKDQLQNSSVWTRLVYEKPFGDDLSSSKKINKYLASVFDESQIFRIDNYLGKELVGTIPLTRFTNKILEPLWNNKHIDSVHINLSENLGIQNRGLYYDNYGAIKDMVQSHMLQLMGLTTMEAPESLSARAIRDAKAAVFKKVIIEKVVVGQCDDYTKEKSVASDSQTETYVAIKASVNNKRWRGVPFYLTTGKYLSKKESSIRLNFKRVKCLLNTCPSVPNYFIVKIFPVEGMSFGVNAKVPGSSYEVTPVEMDFCHGCLFGPNTPESYETLLSDVIKGDQSAFVRSDEVESSWRIVKQIEALKGPLCIYKKESQGPVQAQEIYK